MFPHGLLNSFLQSQLSALQSSLSCVVFDSSTMEMFIIPHFVHSLIPMFKKKPHTWPLLLIPMGFLRTPRIQVFQKH